MVNQNRRQLIEILTSINRAVCNPVPGTVVILPDATKNVAPTDIATSGAGTTTAGIYQLSVVNSGGATGTWNGLTLPIGGAIQYTGYEDTNTNELVRIASITYNATGTTFLISETP